MMGFRYAYENCPQTDYFILVDDDYYVSTLNTLKALPQDEKSIFYGGTVHINAPVSRNPFTKWYQSTKDYPYSIYPDFVSGGFIMLTKNTLHKLYLGSQFTRHFIFDDVYIGIIAYKMGIQPVNNKDCSNAKVSYDGPESYRTLVATHGYDDWTEMIKVWRECNDLGFN